jgi:hypothetical protein
MWVLNQNEAQKWEVAQMRFSDRNYPSLSNTKEILTSGKG